MNKLKLEKALPAEGYPWRSDAVVEVPVLLESRLLPLLASAADGQGMTAGTLVRCLIRDFLHKTQVAPSACSESAFPAYDASTKGR